MDISILSIASVTVTVILFGVLSYLGRKKNIDFGVLTILALIFGILIGIKNSIFRNPLIFQGLPPIKCSNLMYFPLFLPL